RLVFTKGFHGQVIFLFPNHYQGPLPLQFFQNLPRNPPPTAFTINNNIIDHCSSDSSSGLNGGKGRNRFGESGYGRKGEDRRRRRKERRKRKNRRKRKRTKKR